MTTYGNRVASPTAFDRVGPNNNNQKCSVQTSVTSSAARWVRIGGWVERKAADSRIAFGVWSVDASGRPESLLMRTDRFEPPATGKVITMPVRDPLVVMGGTRVGFGFLVSAGDVRIGKAAGTASVFRRDAGEMTGFGAGAGTDPSTAPWAIFAETEDVVAPPDPSPSPGPPPPVPNDSGMPQPINPLPPDTVQDGSVYIRPYAPYATNLAPGIGETFVSQVRPTFSWDCVDYARRPLSCTLWVRALNGAPGSERSQAALFNGHGLRWQVAGTAALMPAAGSYEWWVESMFPGQGEYYRAALSARGLVTWTPPATVAVSSPVENTAVATVRPDVTWTVSGGTQVRWSARLYDAGSGELLRQTPMVGGPLATWRVPISWGLRNGSRYGLEIEVDAGGNAGGVSPRRTFRVEYGPPATVGNVAVIAAALPTDVETSTARLTWSQTALPPAEFAGYVVRRSWGGDPEVTVAHITNPGQLQFWDTACPVNVPVTWRVSQLRVYNAVVTESSGGTVTATIPLSVPTLSSVYDGYTRRIAAMWTADGVGGSFVRPETGVVTWGSGGRPTLVSTPASYGSSTMSVRITLRTDQFATLKQRAEAIQDLVESGDPVVWRGEWERYFCRIASWSWERGGVGQRIVNLELEEIAFEEGIEIDVA